MRPCGKMTVATAGWLSAWLGLTAAAQAAELRLEKGWKFTGHNADTVARVFDLDITTAWTSGEPQKTGVGFTIDFGRPVAIHRIILDPGEGESLFCVPRSLRCRVGTDREVLEVFKDETYHWNAPAAVIDFRFNAVKGRYLRVEIGEEGAGFPWTVAEMRLYGFVGEENLEPRDAVVLPENMPEHAGYNVPGDLGSRDLSYYLGEITGRPVPVVKPEDKDTVKGRLFVIEEPQPEPFEQGDILHREEQSVHVHGRGREIRFAGRTPVAVFYSVVEFLDRQGVRWLYPSPSGDFISRRGEVDLSVLPIRYSPQMVLRWFGGHETFQNAEYWLPYHHWNAFFGGRGTVYRGMGHHSFAALVPAKLYAEHPDWFPMFTNSKWEAFLETQGHKPGDRMPHSGMFCTTSDGAREYIVEEAVKRAKEKAEWHSLMLGQMDADFWCECPRCREQDKGAAPEHSKSERLADLAAGLGRRLNEEVRDRTIQVAAMAYISSAYAPRTVKELPDNVSLDVVICSVRDDAQVGWSGSIGSYRVFLPPGSPQNKIAVEALTGWAKVTGHLGVYTWDLLGLEAGIPKAMISGASEWFRFWNALGVEAVEPEVATYPERVWRCNPWAYYVYSRLAWNPAEPADKIFRDFFTGYFREAAEPMLAYYKTIEDHILAHNLVYGQHGYYLEADADVFTTEILHKMHRHLRTAERAAGDYVTRRRVAGIREGFEIVLKQRDLTVADLNP